MADELAIVLRGLPVELTDADSAALEVAHVLEEQGLLSAEDQVAWFEEELVTWRDDPANPSPLLAGVVGTAIRCGLKLPDVNEQPGGDLVERLALRFTEIFRDLVEKENLGWDGAAAVLGRVRLTVELVGLHRASASHVALLLKDANEQFPAAWRSLQRVLRQLGLEPKLGSVEVATLIETEREESPTHFPDSDELTAAASVDRVAARLGIPECLVERLLRDLFDVVSAVAAEGTMWPYVQILHMQSLVAEFFDHPTRRVYEFSPRSDTLAPLWAIYQEVVPTGNPVLNNLKAVDVIDSDWARSRTARHIVDQPRTLALVSLLELLDSLPWGNRRVLARWLRLWCHHAVDLSVTPEELIEDEVDAALIQRICGAINAGGTGTKGVIEQRFLDACVATAENGNGPIRGLGAAVEEPNLARRRLGDIDVQLTADRQVRAYEATAGSLRQAYVRVHARSLRRAIARRFEQEWSTIDDEPSNWSVEVVFVASSVDEPPEQPAANFGGVNVTFVAMTFEELLAECAAAEALLVSNYSTWMHDQLNLRQTHRRVRRRYQELSAP